MPLTHHFLPFSSTKFSTYHTRQRNGFSLGCFLFSCQGLFDPVPRRSTDSSQGGSFSRCNGGRYECQEWKESTSLTSFFATDTTTHGPSPSSTFGRHEVFETMMGTRYRHVHLGFFFSICPRLGWQPPPPPLATRARARRRRRRRLRIRILGASGEETTRMGHGGSLVVCRLYNIVGQRL